ncbi:MAG: PD-(D/E)XK nuclease family protein, partial [Methylocystis sp.]|nr:PD-(D/E)XK nuclease family protein [Methylocystis sp.]
DVYKRQALPESARAELRALARARSAMFLGDPVFLLFQWPHLESGLDHALAFEMERRACAKKICVEIGGAWTFPLGGDDVFTLTAVADRIEIDAMGRAHVFDYKTGKPPKMKQVAAGWSPQLTLEAAMIEAGAFSGVGSAIVESAAYIALKRADTQWIDAKDTPFTSLVVKHRAELFKLLNQFRNEATPYASRPYVAFLSGSGDYDHLARVKEWMRGGTD